MKKPRIHTYIHILAITTFQSGLWPSFVTYVVCVSVYVSDGTYSLTATIFLKLFHGNFFYSQSFCQKSAERKSPKKYCFFLICVLMSGPRSRRILVGSMLAY